MRWALDARLGNALHIPPLDSTRGHQGILAFSDLSHLEPCEVCKEAFYVTTLKR